MACVVLLAQATAAAVTVALRNRPSMVRITLINALGKNSIRYSIIGKNSSINALGKNSIRYFFHCKNIMTCL